MNLRYKIYILFSCTYKKFINDKFEIKISQLIQDCIEVDLVEIKQDTSYKKLVLRKKPKNKTFAQSVRIMFYIVSIRGLMRTILMLTQPFPDVSNYLKVSRFTILSKILRYNKIFKSQFLDRLSFDFKTFDEYNSYIKFPSIELLNENQIQLYANHVNLVFEKPIAKRYIFNSSNYKPANQHLFIDIFIRWNSKFFMIFIIRNHLQVSVNEFLVRFYPPIAHEINRIGFFEFNDHTFSSFSLDDICLEKGSYVCEQILNAEILNQIFIRFGKNIINLESTSSVKQKFVAGLWSHRYRIYKDQDLYAIHLPWNDLKSMTEGIYLIGRCDENWYHFLIDTLPRLSFFESVSMDVPLLIRADIPNTTKEFLAKLTKRKIVELAPNTLLKVERLYVCPGRSSVFDSKPPKHVSWIELSPKVLIKLRDGIIDSFPNKTSPITLSSILISRKSSKRNLLNAENVKKLAHKLHIQVYELDEDFFRNQMEIFANAKHIISPGGAVLANIIFMKPGSKVTVLRGHGNGNLNIWKQLAEISKVEYSEVRGIPSYWGFNYLRRLHSNFYISLRKLRRIISEDI
jgi:hypothetical protein